VSSAALAENEKQWLASQPAATTANTRQAEGL
jgi:hypothetical protein